MVSPVHSSNVYIAVALLEEGRMMRLVLRQGFRGLAFGENRECVVTVDGSRRP
jgi:hypothetical protein